MHRTKSTHFSILLHSSSVPQRIGHFHISAESCVATQGKGKISTQKLHRKSRSQRSKLHSRIYPSFASTQALKISAAVALWFFIAILLTGKPFIRIINIIEMQIQRRCSARQNHIFDGSAAVIPGLLSPMASLHFNWRDRESSRTCPCLCLYAIIRISRFLS